MRNERKRKLKEMKGDEKKLMKGRKKEKRRENMN